MKRVSKGIAILFLLLVANVCWAQENDFLRGRVLDLESGQPVVFATVRIKDKALGVITNTDGGFQIPQKYKLEGEVLEISSMGYESLEVPLVVFNTETVLLLNMKPAILELEEVTVSKKRRTKESYYKLTAREIVYKAIENLPLNLPQNPYTYIGYYRDYQIKDGNYTNLNEALLQIFDQGLNTIDYETSKVSIFDYRQNKEFPIDSIGLKPYDYKGYTKTISKAVLNSYGGNELNILRIHDPIRNYKINSFDFVNNLQSDFTRNHTFSREEDVVLDESYVYHISVAYSNTKVVVKGDLYITQDDFAILGFDYLVFEKLKEKDGGNRLIFETRVEYEQINGKMYLNYHSMNNSFKLLKPPRFQFLEGIFNPNKKQFVLVFNNSLDVNSGGMLSRYNIRFQGKKLRFESILIVDNEVSLKPNMERKGNKDLINEMIELIKKEKINVEDLQFEVNGIKDVNGNVVNEIEYENRSQFREFFVQELLLEPAGIYKDNLFMDKSKPIFNGQPISKPDNFSDYWMNTPLPNLKN
ncbi:carboxypeptidase-like regulatory domain-containing protein [Maribacter sp. 4G9]|uniref:carboxypeptidase-like regulatory domain-containing protein n=1 Tax=Maribacter sp. 4G9 TaxID=1889777 RepID=UPI000C16009B|nr:carboxypeptidase-like regulatory domain-containing protein [Maribacter sp. 4G9]PIB32656.1 hypothetical protein BFP75_20595 [Maribacter sp. 4G9]